MPAKIPSVDLPTIKELAFKHAVDFRVLRRYLNEARAPRTRHALAACVAAWKELQEREKGPTKPLAKARRAGK